LWHSSTFFVAKAVMVAAVFALCGRWAGAADIELGSRFYPSVEKLASAQLIEGDLFGTRPFSINEGRRLALEAKAAADILTSKANEPSPRLTSRITYTEAIAYYGRDFAPSSESDLGQFAIEPEGNFLKPIGMPRLEVLYLDGEKAFFPGVDAAQNGLVYNNEGIDPEEGLNAYLDFEIEGALGPLSMYVQPLLYLNGEGHGELHKAYLTVSAANLDLELGKRSLWWGQGYHGSLFLTNNAEPLVMARLTNPSPTVLPWIFERLGPFRFDTFLSRLEKDRDVPEPYLLGMRFNFKPHPVVEIGLTRTIIFGGDGRPGVTFSRFLRILGGTNVEETDNELSNSIAGADVRVTLPSVQLYGEWGGEDEAGGFPTHPAYLLGLYFPPEQRRPGFRIEYADLSNKDAFKTPSAPDWYSHRVYTSGYTYEGRILGHHVGGDARDIFCEVTLFETNGLAAKVHFDYEERGIDDEPTTEKHKQAGTELEWARKDYNLKFRLAYERVTDAGLQPGSDENNALASVSLTVRI
jgi:hypothetical protein